MRARSAMAGWSVETQRESKRPKAVMADRVHESRGTFTPVEGASEWEKRCSSDFVCLQGVQSACGPSLGWL